MINSFIINIGGKLLKRAALSMIEQIFFSLTSFIIVAVLARKNAFDALSLYNSFMIISTFFLMLANSGLVTYLNSFATVEKNIEAERNIKKTVAVLAITLSGLGFCLGVFYFEVESKGQAIIFAFLVMSIVIREVSRKLNFYDENHKKIVANIAVAGVGVSSILVLYLCGFINSKLFLVSSLFFSVAVPMLFFPIKGLWRGKFKIDIDSLKFIAYQSASGFLLWGGVNLYLVISESILNSEQNSIIRTMITLGSVIGMLILSLESFLPKFLGDTRRDSYGSKIFCICGLIIAPFMGLALGWHKVIVDTVLGSAFTSFSSVLIMVILWQGIGLFAYIIQIKIRRDKKASYISYSYVAFFGSSLALSFPLIERYEVYGVFYGLVTSQIIYISVLAFFYLKLNKANE